MSDQAEHRRAEPSSLLDASRAGGSVEGRARKARPQPFAMAPLLSSRGAAWREVEAALVDLHRDVVEGLRTTDSLYDGPYRCLHPGQQHGRRWPSSSSS
jgi:hypothetical protein